MIREQHGNLLAAEVDALVNTVNTVGVMGKGIALQFKRAFPANFRAYKRACDEGQLELGRMFVWDAGEFSGAQPRYIINFPTKAHWRSRSKISDIHAGLEDLVRVVRDYNIQSIALPPLGCGHGGLAWSDVKPVIEAALVELVDVDVQVFPPEGAPAPADQAVRTDRPRMTFGRAVLIGIMNRYLPRAVSITAVDIQKLMYFMQEAGEPLKLRHEKGRYGPYADNLRHVLAGMEGHYIRGAGDGSANALDEMPFELLPGALDEADARLAPLPDTRGRFDRVTDLIAGFESTYGLELLATVHWAATRDDQGARQSSAADPGDIYETVSSWNDRKGKLFTVRHVDIAIGQLRDRGWFDQPGDDRLFSTEEP